jgi:tetratricopeptide (TPR) repeat protein
MLTALFLAALALQNTPAPTPAPSGKVAEAYSQFLIGHHLEEIDDAAGAIAAFRRAMELDPLAADVPAELAGVYLHEQKLDEAKAAAEQSVKIAPANREANRVLGIVYASRLEERGDRQSPTDQKAEAANLTQAIQHLELAIDGARAESDPNVRATLGRLYLRAEQSEKAIPLLSDLVRQEPGWSEGPLLLAEAYASAGRNADAIAWLETQTEDDPRLLPALADFYEREKRWSDAAATYGKAVQQAPRSVELRTRYASALLNAGGRENAAKARDVLAQLTAGRTDGRTLYLFSQAQRRAGDLKAAEETARQVIGQNNKSPWGYYALAEALEERHQFQVVIDELTPALTTVEDASMLLPHLAFAYEELGNHDKAIATFEEARRRSPKDANIVAYLAEADIAAKKYAAALDATKAGLAEHPDDLRLMRLQAQALRRTGKGSQGVVLLERALQAHGDDPTAYISLAQMYADIDRNADAIKLLQDAQQKFPSDGSIVFELGSQYDRAKRFPEAEATFQQILKADPENAAALNYLGYMLAERGERLEESVSLLKKALEIEPENGPYLDSLNLHRAADQLRTNSVIQAHYGDVLLRLGRYNDAIAAFTRALDGDGSEIDRGDIDKKIKTAKQHLKK